MPISPARQAAFEILMKVDRGGFASDLLAALPSTLDRRDLNLATELVLGCLRRQSQLDHLARQFSGRSGRLVTEVLIALSAEHDPSVCRTGRRAGRRPALVRC